MSGLGSVCVTSAAGVFSETGEGSTVTGEGEGEGEGDGLDLAATGVGDKEGDGLLLTIGADDLIGAETLAVGEEVLEDAIKIAPTRKNKTRHKKFLRKPNFLVYFHTGGAKSEAHIKPPNQPVKDWAKIAPKLITAHSPTHPHAR